MENLRDSHLMLPDFYKNYLSDSVVADFEPTRVGLHNYRRNQGNVGDTGERQAIYEQSPVRLHQAEICALPSQKSS